MIWQIFIPGLSSTGGIQCFFFAFGGITSFGSASLKLWVCKAASPCLGAKPLSHIHSDSAALTPQNSEMKTYSSGGKGAATWHEP